MQFRILSFRLYKIKYYIESFSSSVLYSLIKSPRDMLQILSHALALRIM